MSLNEQRKKKHPKKRNRFIFRTIVLAVLLVAVVFALVSNLNKDNEIYKSGDLAPDFQLTQISENNDTETIKLSDLRGKGVMLNFWATYCEPCEAEMPYMESLYPEYKDDIEIVAVSLDLNELVINQFIEKYDLTFPIVHDRNNDVMELYKVEPIPSTFFIHREGEIVDKVARILKLYRLEYYVYEKQPD